jgi:hypothetical protein
VAVGFDWEIIEIDAAEDDAGIRWSGEETEVCVNTRVKTHTLGFDRPMDRGLEH